MPDEQGRQMSTGEENELLRYLWMVRRWLWLILLTTFLAAGVALVISLRMTPVYSATATLLVKQAPSTAASDYTAILTSERLIRTYAQMIPSTVVLEDVVTRLGLGESADELAERVRVEAVRDTLLIRLHVEDTEPLRAALLANAIAEVFIAQNRDLQEQRYAASLNSLRSQVEESASLIEATQAQIEALGEPETPEGRTELARLETILAGYRNTYSALLQSYEQMRLSAAQGSDDVVMFEPAAVPTIPVRPRTVTNTALAAVVGLMVGVGTGLLVEYLDDTLRSPEDVRRSLGLTTLGMAPRFNGVENELIAVADPSSPAAEAFRMLRTNLWFSSVDSPPRKLLVTSPGPMEGKSVVLANLAAVMAQAGLRVVVVDADLRRPRQHRIFGIRPQGGLSRALLEGSINGQIQSGQMTRLALLPAGGLPANPAEVLASQRMAQLLDEVARQVDVVLVDSPPVLPVTDATVLARLVDGVVLVLQAGKTRRAAAQQAVERLQQVGGRLFGVVLNGIPPRGSGYYYYYDRYYGKYYGSQETKRKRRRRKHSAPSASLLTEEEGERG